MCVCVSYAYVRLVFAHRPLHTPQETWSERVSGPPEDGETLVWVEGRVQEDAYRANVQFGRHNSAQVRGRAWVGGAHVCAWLWWCWGHPTLPPPLCVVATPAAASHQASQLDILRPIRAVAPPPKLTPPNHPRHTQARYAAEQLELLLSNGKLPIQPYADAARQYRCA
jgi:hypothetical protein